MRNCRLRRQGRDTKKCADAGSPLVFSRDADISDVRLGRDGISFTFEGEDFLCSALRDSRQTENIRTVLCALRLLRQAGYCIGNGALRRGLRLRPLEGQIRNPEHVSARHIRRRAQSRRRALHRKTFSALYPGERAVIVTGVMADKDYRDIADSFSRICDRAFTISPNNPRALGAAAYADALSEAGIYASPCKKRRRSALRCRRRSRAHVISRALCGIALHVRRDCLGARLPRARFGESEQPEAK